MSTTRKFKAETTGPVNLCIDYSGLSGTITVTADPKCTRASLTITTDEDGGKSSDAVNEADIREIVESRNILIDIAGKPAPRSMRGRNVTQQAFASGGGSVTQIAGNNYGDITFNGNGGTFVASDAPVCIEATVPEGSSLDVDGQSVNVTAVGPLQKAKVIVQSGSVWVSEAKSVRISAQSGAVAIRRADQVKVTMQAGSVIVGHATSVQIDNVAADAIIDNLKGDAKIHTVSGRIAVHAADASTIKADTVSGDIEISTAPGIPSHAVVVRHRTVTGRVKLPTN